MCSHLVPVLVLQLLITTPAVVGDCYDDPPNNKTYENCETCYQTLANALIDTGDNKHQLIKAFFPENQATPLEVRVEYVPESQCKITNVCRDENVSIKKNSTRWYWLVGEFYAYQPIDFFVYRSVFFAPPAWRQQCIVLCLPDVCINKSADTFDDYFLYITQRVC